MGESVGRCIQHRARPKPHWRSEPETRVRSGTCVQTLEDASVSPRSVSCSKEPSSLICDPPRGPASRLSSLGSARLANIKLVLPSWFKWERSPCTPEPGHKTLYF